MRAVKSALLVVGGVVFGTAGLVIAAGVGPGGGVVALIGLAVSVCMVHSGIR